MSDTMEKLSCQFVKYVRILRHMKNSDNNFLSFNFKLSKLEIKAMPILLRGAAMRFLLTRLNDILYNKKNALVKMKNPLEYHSILIFHKN